MSTTPTNTATTTNPPRRRARRDTSLPAAARAARGDLLGYARVSTDQQNLALQLDALTNAGCRRIFRDVGSGSLKQRPQLEECLSFLQPGDTLVVWRLDRLGRGLKHLIELVEHLQAHEMAFRSLTEDIDTTTSGGRLTFHIFGALAQFEREIIRERTRAGVAAARERGRVGGRPPALTPDKITIAETMRAQKMTMPAIANALGVSVATLYRQLPPRPAANAAPRRAPPPEHARPPKPDRDVAKHGGPASPEE
jgi:DNA invertase Pin-like site-specific DNA recombinase